MYVIKKDGTKAPFNFEKIEDMVLGAVNGVPKGTDLAKEILEDFTLLLRNEITTNEIQEQLLNVVKKKIDINSPSMGVVAGKILMSSLMSDAEKLRGFEFGELRKLYDYNLSNGMYEDNIDLTEYYKILKHLEGLVDRSLNYTYNYTSVASWKLRYLHRGETPTEVFALISARLALASVGTLEEKRQLGDKYLKALSEQKISLATPFLLNLRLKDGNLSSCFINTIPDDLGKQYDVLRDMALISKNGGGIGNYLGCIRAKGSRIKQVTGIADSVIPYSTLINQTMTYVNQQGKRKGASTIALPVWHADILEFLELVTESGDTRRKAMDLFLQIVVEETFMQSLIDNEMFPIVCPLEVKEKLGWDIGNDMSLFSENFGDILGALEDGTLKVGKLVRARDIFKAVMGATLISGTPYWFFYGNVNIVNPLKDVGSIKAGNLCVTGDTKILTKDGYKEIGTLAGQVADCWDGEHWVPTPLFQTSEGQEVLEVSLDNGQTIKATPYHKWYVAVQDNRGKLIGEAMKRTHELEGGDKLIKFNLEPVTHGIKVLPKAYENGFYTADGCYTPKGNLRHRVYLYGEKKNLLHKFSEYYSCKEGDTSNQAEDTRLTITYNEKQLKPKFFIPDSSYAVASRLEWLAGYLDGDGTVTDNDGALSIQCTSTEYEFITNLANMLQELGVHSRVSNNNNAGYRSMPKNDGSGEHKEYWCNNTWRLLVAGTELNKLIDLGIKFSRLKVQKHTYNREARRFIKVLTITEVEGYHKTYCGTSPVNNKLMFNGALTGNCNESYSVTTEEYTHTCNLVSLVLPNINLDKSSTALEDTSKLAVDILDTIVDISTPPTGKAKAHNDAFRVLGIGAMGLADVMAINKKTYEKDVTWAGDIFERISLYTLEASISRAKDLGTFPLYDKSEWAKGKLYSRDLGWYKENSRYYEEWKTLKDLIGKYGVRNAQLQCVAPNTSSSILQGVTASILPTFSKFHTDSSSLGALPVMPKYIDEAFWYYKEYKHHNIIDMNTFIAEIQKWVDTGISYEWVIDLDNVSIKDIESYYIDAWQKGLKSIYYIRFLRSDGTTSEKEECVSCSG